MLSVPEIIAQAKSTRPDYTTIYELTPDQLPKLGAGYYYHPFFDPETGDAVIIKKEPYNGTFKLYAGQVERIYDEYNQIRGGSVNLAGPGSFAPGTNPEYLRRFGVSEDAIARVQSPGYKAQYASAATQGLTTEQIYRPEQYPRGGDRKAEEAKPSIKADLQPAPQQEPEPVSHGADDSDDRVRLADDRYLSLSDWQNLTPAQRKIGVTQGSEALNSSIEGENKARRSALERLQPYSRAVSGQKVEASKGLGFSPLEPEREYDIWAARSNGVDRETLNTVFGQEAVDNALESRPFTLISAVDEYPGRPPESDYVSDYFKGKGWGDAPKSRGLVRNDADVQRLNEAQASYYQKYPAPALEDYQAIALFDAGIDESAFASTDTGTMTEGQRRALTQYNETIKQATKDYVTKYGVRPIVQQSAQNVLDALTGYKTLINPKAPTYAKAIVVALDVLMLSSIVGRPVSAAVNRTLNKVFDDATQAALRARFKAMGEMVASEGGFVRLRRPEVTQEGLEGYITVKSSDDVVKTITKTYSISREEARVNLQRVLDDINAAAESARTVAPKEIPKPTPHQSTYNPRQSASLTEAQKEAAAARRAADTKAAEEINMAMARNRNLVAEARANEARYMAGAAAAIAQNKSMMPKDIAYRMAQMDSATLNAAIAQSPETFARAYSKADPATLARIDAKLSAAVSNALAQGNATKSATLARADTRTEAVVQAIASTKGETKGVTKSKTESQGKAAAKPAPQTKGATRPEGQSKTGPKSGPQSKPDMAFRTPPVSPIKTPKTPVKPPIKTPKTPVKPPIKPPPDKNPPPTKENPPKKPPPPVLPRNQKTTNEKKLAFLKSIPGYIARRRGELDGKSIWRVKVPPYGPKDTIVLYGVPPEGTRLATGKGSVERTAIVIKGEVPNGRYLDDTGAVDDVIIVNGNKVSIESVRDTALSERSPKISEKAGHISSRQPRLSPRIPRLR